MADGGGDADFTLRLKQDVAGPAAAAKKALKDLGGEFDALGSKSDRAQAKLDANWKKQVAASKASMGKDRAASLRGLASERKAMEGQLALAKQLGREKKQAEAFAGKQAARNANMAEQAKKHAQQAEIAAGKQAARNANLADKAKVHAQQMHLREHDIKSARGGGFDAEELAMGGTEAAVAGLAIAGAAAAAAVAYIGFEFIKASEAASEFQQSSIKAIGYLTDNAPAAEGIFDDVRASAQQLGLGVEDTVGSFQKLLAAQFSVGESKDLIKMGADMQAIGADAEHVQHILYAMSEIKSMGTLQKRQERMLQMAGISGKLIDEALMKRMGLKNHGQLEKARKGNKIGADVAVEAIKDAVMHKTHESALGQRGEQNANETIKGMRGQLGGGIENFFIDTGKAIEPVLTGLALHAKDLVLKIANDPMLAQLGETLLTKWQDFGGWVTDHWPQIESMVIGGLHAIVTTVEAGFDVWQFAEDHWDEAKLALEGLAVAFGILAIAGLVILGPLYLGLAAIAAVAIGLAMLVGEVVNLAVELYSGGYSAGKSIVQGLIEGIVGMTPLVGPAIVGLGVFTKEKLRGSIDSHSPSKDAMDIGSDFGEGYSIGLDNSTSMVKGSAVGLGGVSLDAAGGSAGAPSSGGTPEVHLHVTCGAGATQEDGERFGAGFMAQVDARIYSVFDSLDIEGAAGAAAA